MARTHPEVRLWRPSLPAWIRVAGLPGKPTWQYERRYECPYGAVFCLSNRTSIREGWPDFLLGRRFLRIGRAGDCRPGRALGARPPLLYSRRDDEPDVSPLIVSL